jgi:acid phosphatase family membrane protein YuiD
MATVTFDTLKFANRLKAAGVADKQAEAEAAALAEALGEADVATKRDLKELELKITAELTLIKWMLGILLGGVIALIMKAFFPA